MNFIDSDSNSGGFSPVIYQQDQWSNHPGFIGKFGQWVADAFQPGKAEDRRYNQEFDKQKGRCPYSSGDSCADLDDAYWCNQDQKDANSGSHRVQNRARKAADSHMSKIDNLMEARDCDGRTSGVDTAQEDRQEAERKLAEETKRFQEEMKLLQEQTNLQMLQMQQRQMEKEEEYEKSKTNIMLVAGGAVALTVLIVLVK